MLKELLLMEEILHHLVCIEPCKYWDIYHLNWCRISSINSITFFMIQALRIDEAAAPKNTIPILVGEACEVQTRNIESFQCSKVWKAETLCKHMIQRCMKHVCWEKHLQFHNFTTTDDTPKSTKDLQDLVVKPEESDSRHLKKSWGSITPIGIDRKNSSISREFDGRQALEGRWESTLKAWRYDFDRKRRGPFKKIVGLKAGSLGSIFLGWFWREAWFGKGRKVRKVKYMRCTTMAFLPSFFIFCPAAFTRWHKKTVETHHQQHHPGIRFRSNEVLASSAEGWRMEGWRSCQGGEDPWGSPTWRIIPFRIRGYPWWS